MSGVTIIIIIIIIREISLLWDKLKNLLQNRLKQIAKMQTKKRHNQFRIAKMYNKIQNLLQNKIKQIKGKINLLQDKLTLFKKRQDLLQNGPKQISKMKNVSPNDLKQITKIQNQSRDELEQIAKIRHIKNDQRMTKERLLISLLKSKLSLAELFINNSDNERITGIKKSLNELRDKLTKKYRKKIIKKFNETENKKNLSKLEEEINEYLTELKRILNEKEKYHDRDEYNYYGIRDILFDDIDEKGYYKPIKIYSSWKGNYKKYESRGDENKKLSAKQYLYKIIPYLRNMMNDHKATMKLKNNKTQSGEWKFQLNLNFISSKDTRETFIIYIWSDKVEIMMDYKTDDIIGEFFRSFLNNCQKANNERRKRFYF